MDVRRIQQAGAVMEGSMPSQLECRARDLPKRGFVAVTLCQVLWGRDNDIMSVIDTRVDRPNAMQRADHHLRMFIAREGGPRRDNAIIEVSLVMEDRATTRSPSDKHRIVIFGGVRSAIIVQRVERGFEPWILVAANYHAWFIDIEEEDARVVRGIFQ